MRTRKTYQTIGIADRVRAAAAEGHYSVDIMPITEWDSHSNRKPELEQREKVFGYLTSNGMTLTPVRKSIHG